MLLISAYCTRQQIPKVNYRIIEWIGLEQTFKIIQFYENMMKLNMSVYVFQHYHSPRKWRRLLIFFVLLSVQALKSYIMIVLHSKCC